MNNVFGSRRQRVAPKLQFDEDNEQTAGPFMATLPTPSSGWTTPYAYNGSTSAGTFVISASGDGTTVSLP